MLALHRRSPRAPLRSTAVRRLLLPWVVALAVLAVACSGGGAGEVSPTASRAAHRTTTTTTSATAASTTTTSVGGARTDIVIARGTELELARVPEADAVRTLARAP